MSVFLLVDKYLTFLVSAKPAEDLDYEEESDKEMDEENARVPVLLSKEQELFGKTGANVSLPCEVDDIGNLFCSIKLQNKKVSIVIYVGPKKGLKPPAEQSKKYIELTC